MPEVKESHQREVEREIGPSDIQEARELLRDFRHSKLQPQRHEPWHYRGTDGVPMGALGFLAIVLGVLVYGTAEDKVVVFGLVIVVLGCVLCLIGAIQAATYRIIRYLEACRRLDEGDTRIPRSADPR